MIVFSDLHLREESADTVFGEVLPGITQAAAAGDGWIACLGDFWHIRYRVPVALQNRVAEWLYSLQQAGVSLTLLPGNHDQINGAGENALEVFNGFSGVRVVNHPHWNAWGLWIPYRKNVQDVREALALPQPEGCRRVLWMHHGIKGADMGLGALSPEGLEGAELEDWQAVFCGHFHKRQAFSDRGLYVGSPYQVRASEAGEEKGYGIWDGSRWQFVTTQWGKRYRRMGLVGAEEVTQLQRWAATGELRVGDEVRIEIPQGLEKAAQVLAVELGKQGIQLIATPQVQAPAVRLAVQSGTLDDYARAYLAQRVDGVTDRHWAVYQEIKVGATCV